ncbi:MAG: SDR family NAD(P)-dependent oxidoreductase [Candidatus Micrarchaeota archaeon]|nr:SDR family NAD(P)-dependent oxidoreductase [Candidatus Micrarchaeota archaeon]
MNEFKKDFENKSILITGGTGSIGRALTNVLLGYNPKKIVLMSRHEDLQVQMKREFQGKNVEFLMGDVRDHERCMVATKNMDIVFHAAALKHISDIEHHPIEAIKTNVTGTINVKNAAIANNVENVVGISTDKAVKPINSYGMTKALDERILLDKEMESNTNFSVVRYGNVVGSRGSIIPYWYQLAKAGQPLSITDIRMTRFWITLEDAVKLIFLSRRNPGKLMVKKCKSIKMTDLAEIYKEKFKIKTNVVGMRSGEKVHEHLLSDYEFRKANLEDDFYIVDYNRADLNDRLDDFTSENAEKITNEEMKKILLKEGFYE